MLRRAVELGVNFIDTADSYGPFVAEQLIHKALHPYPDDLVIATKAGLTRSGPGDWRPVGRPEYLRQQGELSLRHLGLERIDLYQLHRIDPKVPLADQVGELQAPAGGQDPPHRPLRGDRRRARGGAEDGRDRLGAEPLQPRQPPAEALLDHAEANGIGFIPWFPLATGELGQARAAGRIAAEHGATPSQLALAWLLQRSPVMLPIPGTSTVAHLEDNIAAAAIELTDEQFEALSDAVK